MAATLALALAAGALTAGSAGAATLSAHGQLLHLAPGVRANANQSNNWFGYNQGSLEQGGKLFSSISGNWTVPTATQHTAGQAEASSDWIGIGGGCVDSGCTVTDSTLIQTGTEQDVSSTGQATYSAWWELVPAPSLTISSITVHPGDQMHASISQVASGADVWTITIQDLTSGQAYSTTVPYPSTMSTAEWIEETPLEIGTNAGFAALPNLTTTPFSSGTVNGSPVKLTTSEQMDLIDSSGSVIGAPSAPNSTGNGFDACAWASSCS
jgi:Peptidase A4 family